MPRVFLNMSLTFASITAAVAAQSYPLHSFKAADIPTSYLAQQLKQGSSRDSTQASNCGYILYGNQIRNAASCRKTIQFKGSWHMLSQGSSANTQSQVKFQAGPNGAPHVKFMLIIACLPRGTSARACESSPAKGASCDLLLRKRDPLSTQLSWTLLGEPEVRTSSRFWLRPRRELYIPKSTLPPHQDCGTLIAGDGWRGKALKS